MTGPSRPTREYDHNSKEIKALCFQLCCFTNQSQSPESYLEKKRHLSSSIFRGTTLPHLSSSSTVRANNSWGPCCPFLCNSCRSPGLRADRGGSLDIQGLFCITWIMVYSIIQSIHTNTINRWQADLLVRKSMRISYINVYVYCVYVYTYHFIQTRVQLSDNLFPHL